MIAVITVIDLYISCPIGSRAWLLLRSKLRFDLSSKERVEGIQPIKYILFFQ